MHDHNQKKQVVSIPFSDDIFHGKIKRVGLFFFEILPVTEFWYLNMVSEYEF